jgi:hypothetical protein
MKSPTVTSTTVPAMTPDARKFVREKWSLGGARFIEFHDQKWFPKFLRDGVTDALQFILSLGGTYRPIVPLLSRAIQDSGAERVVDLCSGGGGPWLWLYKLLRMQTGRAVKICLTDKYPNTEAFESVRRETHGQVTGYADRADAANLPAGLCGFRTMFSSFHHFNPADATAILQNAVDNRQGIGIFEAARRHPLTILSTALVLVAGVATAPFMRPLRISRLFWMCIVPVIPLVLFFDGVISCLRAYSQEELRVLVSQVKTDDYVWQIGEQSGGPAPITYLIGHPAVDRRA